jgi:hypothetical protein
MALRCGKWCVYFKDRDINSICKYCSDGVVNNVPHKNWNDKIDPFEMAKALVGKRENERRSAIPLLSDCPDCQKHSLFYNIYEDQFECMNKVCSKHNSSYKNGTATYNNIVEKIVN